MKSCYQVVELGKHVHQVRVRNNSGSEIEVFSVTNSGGFTRSTEYFSKEVFSKDVSNYKVVKPGQFAYNPSRINVGSIDYLRHSSSVLVSPLYITFECSKDLHADYLLRYLKSEWGNSQIRANTEGAVRNSLKYKGLENIKFPLAPINDQIRIAHLLGKVEGLIAQRKQHIQQLEDLLKSVFLEMFGDPVRNEKGWNKKIFKDLLSSIDSGKSPKCEARPAIDDEWGVLKLGAVTRCEFEHSENKALPYDVLPEIKHEVKVGDLLFSRKNTYELVAACAYVFETRPKLLMPDLIFRFIFKDDAEINPIYVWKLLINDSQRKVIQSFATGAAGSMPNISKTNLKTVELPVPPIELQNQFAAIVEKVEALKSQYQKGLNDFESLYGALSQQAFKGELDLSRVPLVDRQPILEKNTQLRGLITGDTVELTTSDIHLPESDYLLKALIDRENLPYLLNEWLESYSLQLGLNSFSFDEFISMAQIRISELHPEDDFELSSSDYDSIQKWVFKALSDEKLVQTFNEINNRIELKVAQL
ncbi:restriction endonuclease subunit S [Thiomicrorhabdus sp. 6S2-11]|uniref:Restriction endonuclease subunit S n=1 Tax=Thiomicrorhabdus marina TaxID=2818442 RepID=A0ABS3Q1L4_9GAMM|nr:restriction endonuclease subunit S [Thiomicrorhabdus marina]MBO1926203.1 restriction endonuclease subunit S [Thiomicrorhabdus marina]